MRIAEAEVILKGRDDEFRRMIRDMVRDSGTEGKKAGDGIERGITAGTKKAAASVKTEIPKSIKDSRQTSEREAEALGQLIGKAIRTKIRQQINAEDAMFKLGQDIGSSIRRGIDRGGTGMTLGVTLPGIVAGRAAIKMASDLTESANNVQVTFGSASSIIERFGETSAKSFAISQRAANDFTSTFGGILKETGFSNNAIAEMSVNFTKLTADLASFKNLKVEDAFQKLSSGLVGEMEPLKNVGIILNETKVAAEAAALGFKGKSKELTDAQKVLARYSLILKSTKDAQGDISRTAKEAANQERFLKAETEDLAAKFGKELLPLYKDGLKVTRDLVSWFGQLSQAQREQILKWGAIAMAVGPALKVLSGTLAVIGGFVRIREAYVTAQAAMAAADLARGDAALVAAGKLGMLARVAGVAGILAPAVIAGGAMWGDNPWTGSTSKNAIDVRSRALAADAAKGNLDVIRKHRPGGEYNWEGSPAQKEAKWKEYVKENPGQGKNWRSYLDATKAFKAGNPNQHKPGTMGPFKDSGSDYDAELRRLMSQGGGGTKIGRAGKGTKASSTKGNPFAPANAFGTDFDVQLEANLAAAEQFITKMKENIEDYRRTITLFGDSSEEASLKYDLLNTEVNGFKLGDLMKGEMKSYLESIKGEKLHWTSIMQGASNLPLHKFYGEALGSARKSDEQHKSDLLSKADAKAKEDLAEAYAKTSMEVDEFVMALTRQNRELSILEQFAEKFKGEKMHWTSWLKGAMAAQGADVRSGRYDNTAGGGDLVSQIRELNESSEAQGRAMQDILGEVLAQRQLQMDNLGWIIDNGLNNFMEASLTKGRNFKANFTNLFRDMVNDIGREFLRLQMIQARNWALRQIFGSIGAFAAAGGGTGDGASSGGGQSQVSLAGGMAPVTLVQNFHGSADPRLVKESAYQGTQRALSAMSRAAKRR